MSKTAQYRLFTVLIGANLALIWGNSALPADTSGAISGWVLELLRFLPHSELAHTILRKIGHFSEFACLGLLTGWFLFVRRDTISWHLLGFGLAVACVDETIQAFVPGRGPSIFDVWIDTAGFSVGLIIVSIGYTIIKHKKIWRN